jgi:TonB family protein
MTESVSALLESRLASQPAGAFRRAVIWAAVLHVVIALSAWIVPQLVAKPPAPVEYVSVRIVPAARLGVEKPRVEPKPEPASPKPEEKPQPKPEPRKESKAPVLPTAKPAKAPPKPEPAPAPAPEVQGVAQGSASGFALGATATFDTPDFTYGYYIDQMLAQLSRNWNRPLVGSGVEAMIHFRIERGGKILDIQIVRSSGINAFDLAALRAVQASSPLPPLPRAFREDSLGVNLIVR